MRKALWLDLETTGLEDSDHILEAAIVVTDDKLNEIEVFEQVIHQPDSVLDSMNEWCKATHGKSGLIEESRKSRYSLGAFENDFLSLIDDHFGADKPLLCGSSIHFDRRFVRKYWPAIDRRLHYRMIDVSGQLEAVNMFCGHDIPRDDDPAHRALADIRKSIAYQKKINSLFRGAEKGKP